MDISSSLPNNSNLSWFDQLEDVDDLMTLQAFVGDCLVDYPPENIETLMANPDRLHYTLSGSSECSSETSNQQSPAQQVLCSSPDESAPKVARRSKRLPDQCRNHIIAERQRRQTLSQLFIALSALIPGLKKIDKTSVLGAAITHMKQLKEKLQVLEDENARRAADPVVVVQRSRVAVENDANSSSSSGSDSSCLTRDYEQLPEIEAQVFDRKMLIKIHCQMQTGVLSKIMSKIENMNLSLTNTSSAPFTGTTIYITVLVQMEQDFDMSPQEVVANLRSLF